MYFPVYFIRRVGATPADAPVLGSDEAPTVTTEGGDSNKTNRLFAKVGGVGNTIQRVAVGHWYEGAGSASDLPAKLWIFDRNSKKWYVASSAVLKSGEITYFEVPSLIDPPQTSANLDKPTSGGLEAQLVVPSPGGASDGTYHFVMGADSAQF